MAVLCQRVVPAHYAFVIHTHNPVSGDAEEVYAELVLGLGESIVSGQVPGSPLCFAAGKLPGGGVSAPRVLLFPSKTRGMFAPDTVIFRSDSNGEDLEGYAGAGLYDSVTARPSALRSVDYWSDPLLQDEGLRASVLGAICEAGLVLESALAGPQDVEGVIGPDGAITIVQTRPQV
ncbi:hypothetical protein H632_c2665p0 [Helicosporidium sp. ATCC 50920]|nr:hypothetical protein H632_c2665p0 [Helicosporidium sp. ATCC 50920]|eukprot:KDD72981.1 hypothetical protein H632_c2665p0 [Helicosporidium sp. ATCC 50920]